MWKSQLFYLLTSLACTTFIKASYKLERSKTVSSGKGLSPCDCPLFTGQSLDIRASLQAACLRECRPDRPRLIQGDDVCYIAHPYDCFKFVICIPDARFGAMYTQEMSCAFGTMWNDTENACQRSDLVRCGNDPCRNDTETMHKSDENCRTFWKCADLGSEPDCCPRYQRFNPITKTCVRDISCADSCPFLNDATCSSPGVKTLDYGDTNCKTYFDCVNGGPIPTCCPDGYGYDLYLANCTLDPNCNATCPLDYKDRCSEPGVTAYPLRNDSNCRTYMKCNSEGQGERFCCRSGMEFDETLQICIDAVTTDCSLKPCPLGYKEECRLESVPNKPYMYKNLDYFGGQLMPCAVGTIFIQERCNCYTDPTSSPVPPGIGDCQVAIHATLPSLKNNGSVVAALLMIGKYGQGEKGVGNITAFWDGDDGINIPYFGSQAPSKLYIEIIFKPTSNTPGKQILLSSCHYIDNNVSLEISLTGDQNNSGTLTTRLTSPGVGLSRTFTMPYKLREQYNFKLIYDGQDAGAILTQATGPPIVRSKSLTACNIAEVRPSTVTVTSLLQLRGFGRPTAIEDIEVKISKCLTPAMTSELQEILQATRTQPVP